MRHRVAGKKLNRDIKHRKALFKNLISALIVHEEIQTTENKAKAIKGLTDKLISRGKKGTLHARRTIAAFLQNKTAVNKIVDDLGPRFKNRVSGFTRIIRLGKRRGDDTMMVKMEFVEKKEVEEKKAEKRKKAKKEKREKKESKEKSKSQKEK
jgi:large subunit ribosomal protein L17